MEYLIFGAVISGIIGVVVGALRGHKKMGTDFFLGLLLGPIGWLISGLGKEVSADDPAPATSSAAPSRPPLAPAPPGTPAGWYPDPTERFAHRHWDGGRWTEHVHNGTSQHVDPI